MRKNVLALGILLCASLCACGGTGPEKESASGQTEQSMSEETVFLESYSRFFEQNSGDRAALVYLDEDSVPELLILKDGEYSLYYLDGTEVRAVSVPETEIRAKAYGPRHDIENQNYQTFYWFEYVPYRGLVRLHGDENGKRRDYYLKYAEGGFSLELEAGSAEYEWHTYDGEREIENEEFLSQLTALGYDGLVPCGCLYENVEAAYENADSVSDTQKALEDFVNGNADGLAYVGETEGSLGKALVWRSYADFYEEITAGEDFWGSTEYVDFDNDGEEELLIHGYAGACLFFDVAGETVYNVLRTGGTADVAYVAVRQGRRVIARTDLTHAGRKQYMIMEYDSCGCPVDWFRLYVEYTGDTYSDGDTFLYRNREISMEEFEALRDSIQEP